MGAGGKKGAGDRLLEAVVWLLPRFVSLPLLLVLALLRALRVERGLAYLRSGGVGLFYWIDTLWFVGTVTVLCVLVFGRKSYGFGIVAGLVGFVVLHSLIAHSADYFAGYSPADEIIKEIEREKRERAGRPDRSGEVPGEGDRRG